MKGKYRGIFFARLFVLSSVLILVTASLQGIPLVLAAETDSTDVTITSSSSAEALNQPINDLRSPLTSIEPETETMDSTTNTTNIEETVTSLTETEILKKEDKQTDEAKVETEDEAKEKSAYKVDLKAAGTAIVSDWQSFAAALGDSSIHTISLQNDIKLSGILENVNGTFDKESVDTGSGFVYMFVNQAASRKLVIDGGGFTFDFGNLAIGFTANSLNPSVIWDITFQNITIESLNRYAPMFYPNLSGGHASVNVAENLGMTDAVASRQNFTYGQDYKHTRFIDSYVELWAGIAALNVTDIEFISDIVSEQGVNQQNFLMPNIENRTESIFDWTGAQTNSSGGAIYIYNRVKGTGRELTIEGNGYTIDAGAYTICFRDQTTHGKGNTTGATNNWHITIQNVNAFHGNYFGWIEFNDLNDLTVEPKQLFTFSNYTDFGAQFMESPYSKLEFENKIDIRHSAPNEQYTSIAKDGSAMRTWAPNAYNQQGISAQFATVKSGADMYLETVLGNTVHIRPGGDFVVEDGAKFTAVRTEETSTAGVEGQPSALYIQSGKLNIGENSDVTFRSHNKSYSNVIFLYNNQSEISVGKGSVLTVEQEGISRNVNDYYTNAIYMGGGKIDVSGELRTNVKNQGTSPAATLFGGNVTFRIARGGALDMQTDATVNTQPLIHFNSYQAIFQFSDAKRVNLQRTVPATGNGGLIQMANNGTLQVAVQNVYQWEGGNLQGGVDASEGGYDHAYEPMSNMKLQFNGYALKDKTGNSMYLDTSKRFAETFTTANQQRVLFEYVPDPSVEIQSVSNDNLTDPDSITIKGYARPGTYIRLYEVANNGTSSALVKAEEDTILTPIEDPSFDPDALQEDGKTPVYSDNPLDKYTAKADASGDWSYTIKKAPQEWFTANNVIHAFGFNNLKSEEKTQIVLDKTAPTATPVKYYVVKGDPVLVPETFVKDAKDTNPVAAEAQINYAYNSATDIATLMETVSTETNPHKVLIDVSDSAIDPVTGEPMPNTAVIEAELVVLDKPITIDMNAEEITVEYKDIRELTDAELKQWVIDTSGATGYKVDRGGVVDLTSSIIVSDLGKLNDINAIVAADGNMIVTLTIPKAASGLAEDYHATIKVKVINLLSTLTVEFTNEAGDVMPGYTLTITEKDGEKLVVSDELDLTADQYTIQAQLDKLIAAGYEVIERPTKETAFVLDNTEVTVQYKLTGLVYISSHPENFNFGNIEYDATVKQVDDSKPDKDLIVNDTRASKSQWILGARVETPMTHDVEKSSILVDALQYFYGDEKVILNEGTQRIYQEEQSEGKDLKVTNISDTWGTTKDADGIKLIVDPSTSNVLKGTYKGVIQWQFMQGAP